MIVFGWSMRRRFVLESGITFLNHGSLGATPRVVLAAAERWRRRMEANPDRFMRETLPGALRAAAARLARFLGADAQDVAFVENASTGMNAVLRSLELRRGDEILANTHTYNAVHQTIRHVCERTGARLVDAPITIPVKDASSLVSAIERRISKRTRLVVLDHIASPTGLVFPVKRLAAIAHKRGARVLVDGAHAPGQLDLDIPSLGADWYVGNCHKWMFAPRASGFLWARRDAQAGLHPPVISHGYEKGFAAEFDWTGTRDFSAWLAVPDAIEFYKQMKPARIRSHNNRLASRAARRISAAWNMPLDGPAELHASMAGVRIPEPLQRYSELGLMAELRVKHRINVAIVPIAGVLWARLSAQIYNTPADFERLESAISRMAK